MELFSICIFLMYGYGLGHTVTRFIRNNRFETIVIRIGIGLGTLPILALLLNLIHVPLDWRVFLILSLAVPLYDLLWAFKEHKLLQILRAPSKHTLLVIGIFMICLLIYCQGSFSYPWLENDDSWGHAAGIKYITIEKNLNAPQGIFHYLNPYPPGYDLIFGILHQIHPSLYWVLKFFNGFIISLGFLFFYIFMKEFAQNATKGLLATFFLACIPCYLSHFIWAHALVVTLFFPAFYLALKVQQDKRFILPVCLVISGIFLTQPTQSIKFTIMFFLLMGMSAFFKKKGWKRMFIAFMLGVILSLIWWGPRLNDMRTGNFKLAFREGRAISETIGKFSPRFKTQLFAPDGGTATRVYTVKDYFIVNERNRINNPIGVGPILCLLSLWGILYCIRSIKDEKIENKIYGSTVLAWLIFTFLGMNTQTFNLPIGLFAFRFWMLFAIPIAILSAETIYHTFIKKNKSIRRNTVLLAVIIGILITSGYYKVNVNCSIWPWGVYWNSQQEIDGHIWLREHLEPNTKVFAFTDNLFVIGNDMRADFWAKGYKDSFAHAIELNLEELHSRLNERGFQFLIIGGRAVKKYGVDIINEKLLTLSKNNSYRLVYHIKNMFWVFEVV